MKQLIAVAALVTLIFWNAHPGFAQTSEDFKVLRNDIAELKEAIGLQREIEALKDGQKAMQQDLQEIKALLRAQPAAAPTEPQNIVLNVDGASSKGEKTAKLVFVEFTDFQCPFCGRYVRDTLPQIEKNYVDTGVALDADITVDVSEKMLQKFPNGSTSAGMAVDSGYVKREGERLDAPDIHADERRRDGRHRARRRPLRPLDPVHPPADGDPRRRQRRHARDRGSAGVTRCSTSVGHQRTNLAPPELVLPAVVV